MQGGLGDLAMTVLQAELRAQQRCSIEVLIRGDGRVADQVSDMSSFSSSSLLETGEDSSAESRRRGATRALDCHAGRLYLVDPGDG